MPTNDPFYSSSSRPLCAAAIKLAQQALLSSAQQSWASLDFDALLDQAELEKADVYPEYCSNQDLSGLILGYVDQVMREQVNDNAAEFQDLSVKECLFELMMARFDVMQAYRAGFISFYDAVLWQAPENLDAMLSLRAMMQEMLGIAGVKSTGLRAQIKSKALLLLYLMALREWYRDENRDLAGLMRFLDESLQKMEGWAVQIPYFARTNQGAEA